MRNAIFLTAIFLTAILITVLLTAAAGVPADQQQDEIRIVWAPYRPPGEVFSAETRLVEVAATVRDHRGAAVTGLKQSDFEILDEGKPVKLAAFAEQNAEAVGARAEASSGAPDVIPKPGVFGQANTAEAAAAPPVKTARARAIALYFDDTHSGVAGFERSKAAAVKLISNGLPPGERMGIFTSSGVVDLDFTADSKTLLATLTKMQRRPTSDSLNGFGHCPTLTAYQAYMIVKKLDPGAKAVAVADIKTCSPAIPTEVAEMQAEEAADSAWNVLQHQSTGTLDVMRLVLRHLAAQRGDRMLLALSPGFVTGEMDRQTAAIVEDCLRNKIVVNALDDEGLMSSGIESPESLRKNSGIRYDWADKTIDIRKQIVTQFLADAAASTGGAFIHNNNDLTGGLRDLAAAPAVSYLMAFTPAGAPDDKYHKLKVILAKKGDYRIATRQGYFADLAAHTETAQQRIDRIASSNDLLDGVPAAGNAIVAAGPQGGYRIDVGVTVDAKRLHFGSKADWSLQELTFVTIVEDSAGRYVAGKEAVMDLVLGAAKRTELEAQGIKTSVSFFVAKGSYRVREVVREAVDNHVSAFNTPVEAK